MANLDNLESVLGVNFRDQALLKEALTHRSYLNENPKWPLPHNERLEFLGDAVLELVVTEYLYAQFPNSPEGRLTAVRAALVNYQNLALVGKKIKLEDFIFLSRGEAKDTGRAREVILANAMEALLGAIYLDQGYGAAKRSITMLILPEVEKIIAEEKYRDPKSLLQEKIQTRYKITPVYKVLSEDGPDHDKVFEVGVFVNEELMGKGEGPSKQEAEAKAAEAALPKFNGEDK
jgi:ribonuclease-3